jgi:F5/8 type C domain/Glycosyl hydrolases family 43
VASSTASPSATSAPPQSADVIATFRNGSFWKDTAGNRIEAHGGGFLQVQDTWYWIGEDKSHNSGNFKAVNCYASKDLEHWEFRNAILTRDTAPELNASDRIIERPKVIFNDTTGKYVMWLHWEGANYAEAAAGVFSSDTVDGDYKFERSFRPKNNMARDDQLFKDTDGKAYFMAAANENADMILYELTDDYLDIKRQVSTLWASSKREAPAVFKDGSNYFFITSAATGWDPNQAKFATATAMDGNWSGLSDLGNNTTFDTQPTYVIPVRGTKATTYIYAGDRWKDPELGDSKYIWLPIQVNGTKLKLDAYDAWQLNVTTGEWSVNDGFLPRTQWKLLFTDSQETEGEDGSAENAFDDSTSTYWHTAWADGALHPHELQIDLGAEYSLNGFRYYPRQDKDDHGMVADYQFFVSDDPENWGQPVSTGTFGSERSPSIITFPSKTARYIRFVATSEINDGQWASVAEIDVSGQAL